MGDFANDDDKADEDLRAILREKIKEAGAETGDDGGGFDAPLDAAPVNATVSAEDGFDLADKARFKERKAATDPVADLQKTIDDGAGKPAAAAGEGTPAPAADPAKPAPAAAADPAKAAEGDKPAEAAPADIATKPLGDLIGTLEEPARKEIERRIGRLDQFDAIFKGREEELRMHGNLTPQQAVQRFVDLNRFAQEKPDEYLAWVARETNPQQAHAVLDGAAKILGYKLVPDMEAGDEFEDEKTRKLREENHLLKVQGRSDFGPDSPARTATQTIEHQIRNFETEKDATGALLRPHYEALKPQIAALATEQRARTGQPVTLQDIDGFYRAAVTHMQAAFGGNPTSAAQVQTPVPQTKPDDAAHKVEKARNASKNIDGTGQSADRRPALSDEASLRATLRHFMNQG